MPWDARVKFELVGEVGICLAKFHYCRLLFFGRDMYVYGWAGWKVGTV